MSNKLVNFNRMLVKTTFRSEHSFELVHSEENHISRYFAIQFIYRLTKRNV